MAYKIVYSSSGDKKRKIRFLKLKKHRARLLLCAAFVGVVVALCIVPPVRGFVYGLLLPGDNLSTAAAIDKLVQDVENGVTIHTALMDFCRQILEQA